MAGIYIHIPFCKQACNYCNFHFATSLHHKEEMIKAIAAEVRLAATDGFIQPELIETIYFGGGTPSLLDTAEIEAILQAIHLEHGVAENAEITLEANPDDLNGDKLKAWKAAGVNRLSIGVQSFFEKDLVWMHRAHNAVQAREGIQLALQYFDNITIDLIYGVPGLTDERWQQNVETALAFGVPHLSCYALTVEPKTPLDKMIRRHEKKDVDGGKQSEQFLLLMHWLQQAGYEHYEISNFAKPGFRSRHNSAYWKGVPYFGLGPSAHSFNGNARRWNIANNQKYIQAIVAGQLPFEEELLTPVQQTNEMIMIALRTTDGIDTTRFAEDEKRRVLKQADKYLKNGWLLQTEFFLRLTNEGKLYADGIAADLFLEDK
ncbi:MAG: radical SAM family heme chaperone HemW [Niabella sp.]|nr:radical SAM family heme chaperone HemW [Niabella sp.]